METDDGAPCRTGTSLKSHVGQWGFLGRWCSGALKSGLLASPRRRRATKTSASVQSSPSWHHHKAPAVQRS